MKHVIVIAVLYLIGASHAFGEVQWFFGDRDGWFTDVGGPANVTTIGFTEFPNNTTISDQYADLGVTFEGLNFVSGPFTNYHDLWGLRIFGTDTPGNDLYFDKPINWIAADILGHMLIELYDGDELFHTTPIFGVPPNEGFGGLISDRPFDHVRIFDDADPLTVLDDLHFGPPIPTPGALCTLAIAAMLPRRRRRVALGNRERAIAQPRSPVQTCLACCCAIAVAARGPGRLCKPISRRGRWMQHHAPRRCR